MWRCPRRDSIERRTSPRHAEGGATGTGWIQGSDRYPIYIDRRLPLATDPERRPHTWCSLCRAPPPCQPSPSPATQSAHSPPSHPHRRLFPTWWRHNSALERTANPTRSWVGVGKVDGIVSRVGAHEIVGIVVVVVGGECGVGGGRAGIGRRSTNVGVCSFTGSAARYRCDITTSTIDEHRTARSKGRRGMGPALVLVGIL